MTVTIPSGTVTFLFTDIEGSTQLWEHQPQAMQAALARHDALMRQTIGNHGGYVFKTVGDAFCAAFPTALQALEATLAAQRALFAEPWGQARIRVRMALHTGATEERDGDYFGPAVNRVARLLSAGHGGQTLLSLVTGELVRDHLPQGASLHDLGEHRLKDLIRAERIFQLLAPDLPADFPALKTLETFSNNLPVQLTSFIGREKEIADVQQRLTSAATKLVTLTGPGGTGKTRLSLQVAANLLDAFPDGAWLIELAPLADPELVPQTVATVLGLREVPGRSFMTVLVDYLRPKRLLLVLDNCEHLIRACAELAEVLLHTCPHLKILASSREVLGLAGESVYQVPSLSLPDPRQIKSIEALTQYEAVRLFIERAVAVLPSFAVTNENAPAVAQVCHQLDGIPLAIELAAARVKALRVEQIATRLNDRFRLLTGGSRTALPRQQTLQALIDWGYDLLSEPEQVFLQRLGVFAGGWTLEAAEAVGGNGDLTPSPSPFRRGEFTPPFLLGKGAGGMGRIDVLDLLAQLANKSLVVIEREPGVETRYHLLETIRQYALGKLAASGEADTVRRRHATYYLALAEAGAGASNSASTQAWQDRMETEHDNMRAALAWSQSAQGGAELGLRLAGALGWFWNNNGGYWSEGRGWLEGVLAHAEEEQVDNTQLRAWALFHLGFICSFQSDYVAGESHLADSLKLLKELGDVSASAWVLSRLGWLARERGDTTTARLRLEESLATFRKLRDKANIAEVLNPLGEVLVMQEDAVGAKRLLEESLTLFRELGNPNGIGWALNHLGHVAQIQDEYERATRLHEESLPLFRETGPKWVGIPWAYQGLGETALAQGDASRAATHLTEALGLFRDLGDRAGVAWCLAGLAGVAVLNETPERGAWLWGAAEALRQSIGAREAPASRVTRERLIAQAREQLGEAAFNAKWAEGQAASSEQAIAQALQSNG